MLREKRRLLFVFLNAQPDDGLLINIHAATTVESSLIESDTKTKWQKMRQLVLFTKRFNAKVLFTVQINFHVLSCELLKS